MSSTPDVLGILRTLRRRLHLALFLERLAVSALIGGAGLVIYGALRWWLFGSAPLDADSLAVAAGAVCVLAIIGMLANRRSLAEVAALIDTRGQTRDRFVTTLTFSQSTADTGPMRELAERECA